MTSDVPYLQHVLDAIGAIAEFTTGGREEFLASRLVRDATPRNLQTLAEATQRLAMGAAVATAVGAIATAFDVCAWAKYRAP